MNNKYNTLIVTVIWDGILTEECEEGGGRGPVEVDGDGVIAVEQPRHLVNLLLHRLGPLSSPTEALNN